MAIAALKPAVSLKMRFTNVASGLKKVTTDIGKSSKILLKKTKVKGDSIRQSFIFGAKRRESVKRNEKESEIEAEKVGTTGRVLGQPMIDTGKDLLGRLMDAIGSFVLGWLLNNLPTIMTMAQNLIIRLQRAAQIIGGFFTNIFKVFTGTAKIAGALLTNIITLDIFDTNKRVQTAFSDLYNTFGDMKSQIEEGIGLVTKPLGEMPGEEYVPETGTDYTTGPGGYVKAGLSGTALKRIGNDAAFLGEVKRVSQKYGIKEGDLLGLIASESGFNPAAGEIGGHVGLIQFSASSAKSVGTSQAALKRMSRAEQMKYVDKYFENWNLKKGASAGQLYATVFAPAYASGDPNKVLYSSPSREYRSNAPLDSNRDGNITVAEMGGRIERKKREFGIQDQITLGQPLLTSSAAAGVSQLPITPGKRLRSGDTLTRSIGKGVSYIEITDAYGARGGSHKGLDIAAPNGTYIALRYDCEVVAAGWYGDYGNTMDVWVPQLGVQLRMAHLSAILIKSGKISAGTSFARVGSTGRSSGPHIHFEYDTKKGRSNYGGSGDPSAYVNTLLLTSSPNRGSFSPVSITAQQPQSPNLAVVESQPTQRPSLPPQRKAPQVAVVDDRPQQIQVPNIPSGNAPSQASSIISNKEMVLNNLIKNHILLDLAYT